MNGKKELITRAKATAAALLLTALLLTSLILTVKHSTPTQPSTVTIPVEIPTETAVKVQVYRGGQLVAEQEKVGDRLLYNFWALILNAFLGRYYNSPLAIYKADGTTFTQPEWEYLTHTSAGNPLLAVGFGSSSSSVSFFDYELPSLLARVDVPSTGYSLADNGTHIIVSATVSWTASSTATVADVGLYWKGYSYGSSSAFYVLIARDILPSPIAVVANDVVIVTYTIAIAYSRPPILKNLAALIANYILGAKYYGRAVSFITWDGTSTTVMDIGCDFGLNAPGDNVKEYLYVGATSDQRPFMPTMSSVGILAETSSAVTVSWGFNSTHVWFRLPAAPILMPSGGTVTAVYARIRDTDIDPGNSHNAKQVMVLYFPLDQPVTVPAGSGVKFEFTIYFRW